MQTTKISQTIRLIDQSCSPSDAIEILNGLVQEYIRIENILNLQKWEHNHHFQTGPMHMKINELKVRQNEMNALISQAKLHHKEVKFRISVEVDHAGKTLGLFEKSKMNNN